MIRSEQDRAEARHVTLDTALFDIYRVPELVAASRLCLGFGFRGFGAKIGREERVVTYIIIVCNGLSTLKTHIKHAPEQRTLRGTGADAQMDVCKHAHTSRGREEGERGVRTAGGEQQAHKGDLPLTPLQNSNPKP